MARREVVDCDFCGEPAVETVELRDKSTGNAYEADACVKHKDSATLARVREKGRPVVAKPAVTLKDASMRQLAGRIRDR